MNRFAKISRGLFVLVVMAAIAVGIGLFWGWYLGRQNDVALMPPPSNSAPVVPPISAWIDAPASNSQSGSHRPGVSSVDAAPPAMDLNIDTRPWQQQLDGVLLGAGELNEKSDKILGILTNAPADAQVELSQHLINLTQDDHYDGVAGLLTNAATQPAVATVLMNDLLNRHNPLKLPMLLDIARNTDHPLSGQAKDMLELFIQQDYGTNWDQWSTSIDTWLQQNQ